MPDGAFPRAELLRGALDPDALAALDQAGMPEAEPAGPAPSLARRHGATRAGTVLLRLPSELRDVFTAWLEEHVPDRARRILALIRETRARALNDSRFHHRFSGGGSYADLLAQRFARARRQLGFLGRDALDCSQFRCPPAPRDQLSLL